MGTVSTHPCAVITRWIEINIHIRKIRTNCAPQLMTPGACLQSHFAIGQITEYFCKKSYINCICYSICCYRSDYSLWGNISLLGHNGLRIVIYITKTPNLKILRQTVTLKCAIFNHSPFLIILKADSKVNICSSCIPFLFPLRALTPHIPQL